MLCFVIPVAVSVIHLSVVIQHRRRLSRGLVVSLVLNTVVPLMAGILQMFAYGLSLINISVVGMSVLLYVFALLDLEEKLETAHEQEHALFVETATALVNAIEKKDTYTRGHSRRVAVYSMMIAREAGKSAKECDEIYYAGLLHDVGKIGVAGSIINKNGRLTDEEFGEIKKHPAYGEEILRDIEHPYLRAGAQYHHERYDGKGYPTGLSGKELPEVARIIAVADSYDAMTSKRSYRDPLPQQKVREEIVKGIGTQFDPEFAEIMVGLIDRDVHYSMRESN
ncbi:MAG: HD-GYP domain-containing protein [Lachnospiraceae bacterium]|nr:HD-GYP domain-containing protein [Lachnospiraceae bacterium]